jgi:polysaccharide pyruvyl transferase WcaK-like protein
MKCKGVFIGKRLDIPTTLSIVSRSTLIISVRLHMLIYAAVMSVPAIGIAYDPKVSNFQKYINQPYFLDPRALLTGDYKALVDDCIANGEEIKKQLEKTTEELKEKAQKTAKIAIRLMEEDE